MHCKECFINFTGLYLALFNSILIDTKNKVQKTARTVNGKLTLL